MSDVHDLRARAGHLERAISETDDQHGSLLSGLESGLSTLRDRLVEAKVENDQLVRENLDLKAIAEQLLGALENKPAESLHDKLAALGGQLHGLLEFSDAPATENGVPVNGTPVGLGADGGSAEPAPAAVSESGADQDSGLGATFDDIRERMRALSGQLLAPAGQAIAARAHGPESVEPTAPNGKPVSIRIPAYERPARRDPGSPRAFDRPIKALADKAQSVLPKVRQRFDAETNYAISILRRLKGGRQPFSIEEVRELINGKFGLTLTEGDDIQLSASLANQDGVTRGPRAGGVKPTQTWRFEPG